jgi:hypothetical protein
MKSAPLPEELVSCGGETIQKADKTIPVSAKSMKKRKSTYLGEKASTEYPGKVLLLRSPTDGKEPGM